MLGLDPGIYRHKTQCRPFLRQLSHIRKLLQLMRSVFCGKCKITPLIFTSSISLKSTHRTFFGMRTRGCNCAAVFYIAATKQTECAGSLWNTWFHKNYACIFFSIALKLLVIFFSLEFRRHVACLVQFVEHICTGKEACFLLYLGAERSFYTDNLPGVNTFVCGLGFCGNRKINIFTQGHRICRNVQTVPGKL